MIKRTRASAAREYVEQMRRRFKEPMEWREAACRYSAYLSATLWNRRKTTSKKRAT